MNLFITLLKHVRNVKTLFPRKLKRKNAAKRKRKKKRKMKKRKCLFLFLFACETEKYYLKQIFHDTIRDRTNQSSKRSSKFYWRSLHSKTIMYAYLVDHQKCCSLSDLHKKSIFTEC